jgi:hypothetical protein
MVCSFSLLRFISCCNWSRLSINLTRVHEVKHHAFGGEYTIIMAVLKSDLKPLGPTKATKATKAYPIAHATPVVPTSPSSQPPGGPAVASSSSSSSPPPPVHQLYPQGEIVDCKILDRAADHLGVPYYGTFDCSSVSFIYRLGLESSCR